MKQFEAKNIKNVALLGHSSCGKTTLCEAMLNVTGAIERLGSVADGTTVSSEIIGSLSSVSRPDLSPSPNIVAYSAIFASPTSFDIPFPVLPNLKPTS